MSRLRMNERVPWRTYSNSRRSTLPGASGRPGCLRSSAWTPVNSSVLMVRSPRSARLGASWYAALMAATLGANSTSGAGVSQYRTRWGLSAPDFKQARRVARGDPLNDAAFDDFVGHLPGGPLADRARGLRGRLAGQGDDPADLVRGDPRRRPGPRSIGQPLRGAQLGQ